MPFSRPCLHDFWIEDHWLIPSLNIIVSGPWCLGDSDKVIHLLGQKSASYGGTINHRSLANHLERLPRSLPPLLPLKWSVGPQ